MANRDSDPSTAFAATDAVAALLRWYAESGVEDFVLDEARDRFAETASETERRRSARTGEPPRATVQRPSERSSLQPEQNRAARSAAPAAPAPVLPSTATGDAVVADARERARSASDLAELKSLLADFTGCGLRATAKSLVFGNGAEDADLMLVGEAPGREEDLAGEPFVGRSGQLLNRMLAAIGLERTAVRVTNTVPWRPPGNRTPTPAETEMCLPFVLRQIELVQPRVVLCLGSPSMKALLGSTDSIMRMRGRWANLTTPNGSEIPAMALLHPAYLLRQPGQKRLAWRDLVLVKQRLDQRD